jgi:S1-C subfamily serine protease
MSAERRYSGAMRPVAVAAIALVTAVLGGVVALVLGTMTGVTDHESSTVISTVVAPVSRMATAAGAPLADGRFDPAAIYASRAAGVVTLYADLGPDGLSQGSGFVVDATGTILTNAHVVTNVSSLPEGASPEDVAAAEQLFVEFADGDRVPARIVGWDLFSDVAVARVDPADHALQPVPLGDSDAVVVGAPVAAIGSPFNEQTSLSVGVVSAVDRSIASLTSRYDVAGAIQTDASINRGNSGGPLFDAKGRVIGINAQIRSNSGTAEGVGFAIPIDIARRAMNQLVRTGRVRYAYLGITTRDVTRGLARRFGLAVDHGALVSQVEPGTPASKAGVRGGTRVVSWNGLRVVLGGDVIVKIGPIPVTNAQDVSRAVTRLEPGRRVPLTLFRGGRQRQVVQVTLSERPATP